MKPHPNTRSALALLLVAVVAQAAAADPASTVKIRLHAMPAARPALKYQLLPPFLDRRPGNAAVWWNRISADQTRFFEDWKKAGGLQEKAEKWLKIPLDDPREKQFREREPALSGLGRQVVFADMDYAARFESCDWQLPLRETRMASLRIPELLQTRTYGRLLQAKARLEIAENRYDQAMRTIQTGLALARHAAQGQTLIHGLVGAAIARMMGEQLEQYVQQSGTPNLYWALAALPSPVVDLRPGFEAEMNSLYLNFPALRDLDSKQLTPDQWRDLLQKFVDGLGALGEIRLPHPSGLMVLLALQGYPGAKRHLIERGRPAAEVEAMPVAQVVLLYTVQIYQETSDELFKYCFLPYPEGAAGLDAADANVRRQAIRSQELIPLATLLLPAAGTVKNTETRTQLVFARLRVLEALRIYAAVHEGRLPDRLSEIREVPIPANPYTGQPFDYRREADRAVLRGDNGRGEAWRYEITIAVSGEKR